MLGLHVTLHAVCAAVQDETRAGLVDSVRRHADRLGCMSSVSTASLCDSLQ